MEKNSILFQASLRKSATVHFRLTFAVKDPNKPGVTSTRVLYTPPITFNYGTTPPTATGRGYFNVGAEQPNMATFSAPEPRLAPPEEPPGIPGFSLPVRSETRTAQRGAADFSTDLFPPLPAK